jgi:histidyl-tRNA synthetase
LRTAGIVSDIIASGSPKKRYDKAVKLGPQAILRVNASGYYGISTEAENPRLETFLKGR